MTQISGPISASKKVKRVNVQLPDEVHTRAKVIAVLKGITLNEYLEAAISAKVDKDKHVLQSIE